MKRKLKFWELLKYIVATEAIGILGAMLSGSIKTTYLMLNKPPLAPPAWLFGVVWPVLYLLNAYAAYRVSIKTDDKAPLRLYWLQLLLNLLWTPVFFRFKQYTLAVVVLVALIVTVFMTAISFRRYDKRAFNALIPYLLWLLFALYLNVGVALLN